MSFIKPTLAALCLIALVAAFQTGANPLADSNQNKRPAEVANDPLPIGDDGSLFLAGGGCNGDNEYLASGSLPICEPTCSNPRPACPKVFYSNLDFVPCFCKKPLVRNEKTKQCVELSQCPK